MSEQEQSASEQQLADLKRELREEIRAELLQQLDSRAKNTSLRLTLDVVLIALGFLLFLACLAMPALDEHSGSATDTPGTVFSGFEAARLAASMAGGALSGSKIFNQSSVLLYTMGTVLWLSISVGNALMVLSPLGLIFRKCKLYFVFPFLFGGLCINAAMSIFILIGPEFHPLIGYFVWVLAFAVSSLGYLVRYVRLCKPDLTRLVPLTLAFMSITVLLPGVCLPALSLEGTVYKAKAFEASKSMIVDAMVKQAEAKGGGLTSDEKTKAQEDANKGIDELLGMIGFGSDAIQGTIKVYAEERSILTAVRELYSAGYGFVAFLVILFSVIVPTVKTCLIIAYSITKKAVFQSITEVISKWSMADVFAMALIIACLAANSYKFEGLLQMNASLQVGFYFFVAYCLLSIASSQVKITDYLHRRLLSIKTAA